MLTMKTLYLYTTSGCHLCEQAEQLAHPILALLDYELEKVEIADSDELMDRYGIRIPVMRCEGSDQELGWPFDQDQLFAFLKAHS